MVFFYTWIKPKPKSCSCLKRCSFRGWNFTEQLQEAQPKALSVLHRSTHFSSLSRCWITYSGEAPGFVSNAAFSKHHWGFTPRGSREMWLFLALEDRITISYKEKWKYSRLPSLHFSKTVKEWAQEMGEFYLKFVEEITLSLWLTGSWKAIVKDSIYFKLGFLWN